MVFDLVYGELGDADEAVCSEFRGLVDDLFVEQREREASWSEPTSNDALDMAFMELDALGIVALQNAGYTMSDGWSDANEVASGMDPAPRGATFYHGQDLERGVAGEGLQLAFGAYGAEPNDHDAASVAIAREVCTILAKHGLQSEWDETVNQRIRILPFEWKRRLE